MKTNTQEERYEEAIKTARADKQKFADAHEKSSFGYGEADFKEDEIDHEYRRLAALGLCD